ncbi:MAG: hypothetical protein JEY91_15555 [Spirochaetaceae bacterium]|nr:hypothetical protein [Spirochaetaceae bacterium]
MPGNIKAAEEAGTSIESIKRFMTLRNIPKMFESINSSGKRAAEIVSNMLSFSRDEHARKTSHNINELIEKTIELASTDYNVHKQYDFKKIQIQKEFTHNLPLISCEESKIQQVLLNIFRNGAQAMQEAHTENPTIIIRTMFNSEKKMNYVEIEDNGPGMTNTIKKRIFEPFFTTKENGIGTGLGLSVSYFIITENHKGEMSVISEVDIGTRFIIGLPL